MGYLGGLSKRLRHGTDHLICWNIALVITLWLRPLIEQMNLLMIPQWHAPILSHIFGHPHIFGLYYSHLLILTHLQVLLYLPYFTSGHISLNLNLNQQFADHLILKIGEHEPVTLYAGGRIMQLDICLADFVACKIDRLFEESYVNLLPIRNLAQLPDVSLHRQRSLTVLCEFLVIEAKL